MRLSALAVLVTLHGVGATDDVCEAAQSAYGPSIDCPTSLCLTELPTAEQWGAVSPGTINGSLYLGLQAISRIPKNGFAQCPYRNATDLNLVHNNITVLEPDGFKDLTALKFLYLDNNQITSVGSKSLAGLSLLEVLVLGANQITRMEAGSLDDLTLLKKFFLGGNRLGLR